MKFISLLMTLVIAPSICSAETWLDSQKKVAAQYLLENISRWDTPKGFVVASPSKIDPNYYYHWVRDAALVMRALDKYLPDSPQKHQLFMDYLDIAIHHQNAKTLSSLGEPKFNPDGSGFSGPWGRPQNDGPALRAMTLIYYSQTLLANQQADLVRARFFPAIKTDLEYVSHNWRLPDFDLWEEVKGQHFYTRMAQRTALFLGAQLFRQLGDDGAAVWYERQVNEISSELENHWLFEKGYVGTTLNQVEGLNYKSSNLDASTILAVNHSWVEGLSFGPQDTRIQLTYQALVDKFRQIYPLNSNTSMAPGIGRYPEDQYYGGNPWFILTNGMAEYLYRAHQPEVAESFLKRTRQHIGNDGRMSEQYSKHNGYMLGASDLTWSYASLLTIEPNEH